MRLPFLRKAATGDEPLVVSMTGARLGDAVVFAGQSAALVLPLAARTGLSGRCLVVGPPESTAALEATATREGLLVEVADRFPDRSLVRAGRGRSRRRLGDSHRRRARLPSAAAAGSSSSPGRRARGCWRALSARPAEVRPETIVETLTSQGWQRARPVGERDGLLFVEAFG